MSSLNSERRGEAVCFALLRDGGVEGHLVEGGQRKLLCRAGAHSVGVSWGGEVIHGKLEK